jgi:hypothetical protein
MSRDEEPQWQPLSKLPMLAYAVDGMYESAQEGYGSLLEARDKPHVLDDATVLRALQVYQTQLDDLWLYREQFQRWQVEKLSAAQRKELARLSAKLDQHQELLETILELLEELKHGTIEQVLRKSDLELGLEAVTQRRRQAQRPQPHPLPALTLNQLFMTDLLAAQAPCFALGLVEADGSTTGCIAMRPVQPIPEHSTSQGFRFGHSMVGNEQHQAIHVAFEFYGYGSFHGLVDPSNPLVCTVLDRMLSTQDYFFLALNPDQTASVFRSHLEDANLVGLRTSREQFADARCPPAQYERMVVSFKHQRKRGERVMTWVCRDNSDYLDLSTQRMTLNPSS